MASGPGSIYNWVMCWQVLNLLLYALTQREPDQQLLEFLAVDETLVDIGDDLVDYEVWITCGSQGLRGRRLSWSISAMTS